MSSYLQTLLLAITHLPAAVIVFLVKCYQWLISPWLGPRCRFQPTCSNYFIQAVNKYGVFWGDVAWLASD